MEKVPIIQWDTDFLFIIDVQNDLLPGGANPVINGNEVIEPIMRICPIFKKIMIALLTFPQGHPILGKIRYCVWGSQGAEYPNFPSKFRNGTWVGLIKRGNPNLEINQLFSSGAVASEIRKLSARRIFLCGLPLDTTIKEIAITLKDQGFEIIVFEDGTRPTNQSAGKIAKQDMEFAGISFMKTSQFFE